MTRLGDVRAILREKFVRESGIYFLGGALNAALPFLFLPVFTRLLSPTDYGIVATGVVLTQVLSVVLGLNSWGLVARSQYDSDHEAQRKLVSTYLGFAGLTAIAAVVLLTLGGDAVESYAKFPRSWIPAIVIVALTGTVQTIYLALLQARNRPGAFIGTQFLNNVLSLSLSLALILGFGLLWEGRLLATVIAGVVTAGLCLFGLWRGMGVVGRIFDRNAFRSLLQFGVPLMPHFAGGWVMTMVPRLFLNNMASVADTGLYSLGYNIASPLALVIGAANQAYVPALFSRLGSIDDEGRFRLARILLLAAAGVILGGVVFGLAAFAFVPWIVGSRFHGAAPYSFWVAVTFALQGAYFIFGNFVVYSKQTKLVAWRADFAGGIVVLVSCPLLIRLVGPIGAAQATLLGFAVSCIGAFTASRTAFPMPWGRALKSFFTGGRDESGGKLVAAPGTEA